MTASLLPLRPDTDLGPDYAAVVPGGGMYEDGAHIKRLFVDTRKLAGQPFVTRYKVFDASGALIAQASLIPPNADQVRGVIPFGGELVNGVWRLVVLVAYHPTGGTTDNNFIYCAIIEDTPFTPFASGSTGGGSDPNAIHVGDAVKIVRA